MSKADAGLRQIFQSNLPKFHWIPIETGGIIPGVPDSNGCLEGKEVWVEHKQTDGWAVGLNAFQVQWIHRRTRAGGNVWVAVRRHHTGGPRKGPPVDELYLVAGQYVIETQENGLRWLIDKGMIAGMWSGGPSNWAWPSVQNLLLGS